MHAMRVGLRVLSATGLRRIAISNNTFPRYVPLFIEDARRNNLPNLH